jgi:invasion protein IalB
MFVKPPNFSLWNATLPAQNLFFFPDQRAKWRHSFRQTAFIGAALAFTVGVAPQAIVSQAQAQGAVKSTHGDWQMRCEIPPGAKTEQCALVQSVAAEDKPNVTLLVIALKTADQKSRLLRVVAPLGVLLPSGLGLKIDDKDIGRAGFVRCLTTGCVAEVVMDDNLVGQFRTGKNATFIVFQTPEEGIGIPVSLEGFAKGLESLP